MIQTAQSGSVRTLVMDRPETLNAFDATGFAELADALEAGDADPNVSVLLLTGSGRSFSSGADRKNWELVNRDESSRTFQLAVTAMLSLSKPLVCAVNGLAIGFGATLLGYADLVLMADEARVRLPFGELGTVPEAGSSVTFPALLGPQQAFWILIGSPWLSGAECVDVGLALKSCPADELAELSATYARQLALTPVELLQASKRLLTTGRAESARAAMAREIGEGRRLLGENS